jgi:hypothetical protein
LTANNRRIDHAIYDLKGIITMKRTRFTTFATLAALTLALGAGWGTAQTARPGSHATDSGFSFAVYGDSRSMMYLPPGENQKEEAIKLVVDMFELVMPEKIAEAVVRKDVKLIYDPATKELVQIVMPFMTRSEVMTLTVDKGWVTEASVEDVKLLPGVRRVMFRLHGGFYRFCSPHGNEKVIECPTLMQSTIHAYKVQPRKDKRGVRMLRLPLHIPGPS